MLEFTLYRGDASHSEMNFRTLSSRNRSLAGPSSAGMQASIQIEES